MATGAVPRRGKRVTSNDVAREAGVSRTTVSFVLNDTPNQVIPDDTRRRVLEAAARLAYRPSAEARALRRGRSDVVLLYLPPSLPLSADLGALVEQLSTAFVAVGLTMVTHTWTSQPAADVWAAITPAAVLAWDLGDADAEAMRRGGVRVVTTLTGGSDPIGHWARGRRENAIADAQVSRVAEAGFARLGYMYPADPGLEGPALLRRAALARACGDRGLREPEPLRIALEAESAAASLATLAAGVIGRLAVCAHDVDSALAALAGARLLGMRVPEDLAVIGVHDAPAAGLADPPLTVVAVDAAASARYMAAVVYALLEGRPVPAPDFDVAGLIERASVPGRA